MKHRGIKLRKVSENIESIHVPCSIVEISDRCFGYTEKLRRLDLSHTRLEIIGVSAFVGSSIEEIILPETLTVIETEAFHSCCYLKSINLPKNLVSIGYSAFCHCSQLRDIMIPKSVKEIGEFAFYNSACNSSILIDRKLYERTIRAFNYNINFY